MLPYVLNISTLFTLVCGLHVIQVFECRYQTFEKTTYLYVFIN